MSQLTDLTSSCIRCGFCLESCPTFLLTGQETESPRGRIYLVRSAEEGAIEWADARPHLEKCLGCRACETACPSGVHYGEIFELARARLDAERPNRLKHRMLNTMTEPGLFKLQLAASKLLGGRVPGIILRQIQHEEGPVTMPTPQVAPPLDLSDLDHIPVIGEVDLLEGCVMRVLFPGVHVATRRLLRRLGFEVRERDLGCCGALHAHNGLLDEARRLARALPSDLQVVVNSAGCGSWMKDSGVPAIDISEFLVQNGLHDLLAQAKPFEKTITYHDACHLAHGQRVTQPPRQLLRAIPGVQWVDLRESDLCCGSAGIYNVTQPQTALELRNRKWANIEATGAEIVALGNPGCHAWLLQAPEASRVQVMHTAELLELVLQG